MAFDPDDSFGDYEQYSEYYENQIESGFDIWDYIPGTGFLTEEESAEAFDLFYHGFIEGDIDRTEFYDYMGMDYNEEGVADDFPWEMWREFMGY